MNIQEFYERSVAIGIEVDVRGRAIIERDLAGLSKAYEQLPTAAKVGFDVERLTNPFGDTRPVHGDEDITIYPCGGYLMLEEHFLQ